jgi:D-tyrosyl-tRNA(Tyr) deacylase
MIGLLQRVTSARVSAGGQQLAAIGHGLLVLVGVQRGDSEQEASRLLERLLGYRVFPDSAGRMNLNVGQAEGGVLLVPQFTLAADTGSGMRPSFTSAADPAEGRRLFNFLVIEARQRHQPLACGEFAADMQVALVNDGPVTFWLEVAPQPRPGQRA